MNFKIVKNNIHIGHRQRLLKRIFKDDGNAVNDRELLEALLFGTFRNGDVSETAVNLLERFDTLDKLLCADEEDLRSVSGIGESVVQMIMVCRVFMRRVLEESVESGAVLKSSAVLRDYCEGLFLFSKDEEIRLILLDSEYRFLTQKIINNGAIENVKLDMMKIMKHVTDYKASVAVLTHNHPKASIMPSEEDRLSTRTVFNMLERTNVYLADHIIVGVGGSLSMRENNIIPDLWAKDKQN